MKKICSKLFANLFFAVFGMSSVLVATNGNVGNVVNNAQNVAYYQNALTTNFIIIGGFNILFNESVNNLIELGVFGPKELASSITYSAYTQRITDLANLGNENCELNKIALCDDEFCLKYPSNELSGVYQKLTELEQQIKQYVDGSINMFNQQLQNVMLDEARNFVNSLGDIAAYNVIGSRQSGDNKYIMIALKTNNYQMTSFFVKNQDLNILEKQSSNLGVTIILRQNQTNSHYEIVYIVPHYDFDRFSNDEPQNLENHFAKIMSDILPLLDPSSSNVQVINDNNEANIDNNIVQQDINNNVITQPQYNNTQMPQQVMQGQSVQIQQVPMPQVVSVQQVPAQQMTMPQVVSVQQVPAQQVVTQPMPIQQVPVQQVQYSNIPAQQVAIPQQVTPQQVQYMPQA